MQIVESYRDLCIEIELLEWLLDDIMRQQQRNDKDMHGHKIPFLKTLSIYDNLNERRENLEEAIAEKLNLKRNIEEGVKKFTGIQYVVAFNRDILDKSLQEIADESGYQYNYIKKISHQQKKHEVTKR